MQKKFRGKSFANDDYVYGGFYQDDSGDFFIRVDDKKTVEIRRESLSQLCGYDKEGNELYEGDIVADGNDDFKICLKMDWEYYSPGREKNFVLKAIRN